MAVPGRDGHGDGYTRNPLRHSWAGGPRIAELPVGVPPPGPDGPIFVERERVSGSDAQHTDALDAHPRELIAIAHASNPQLAVGVPADCPDRSVSSQQKGRCEAGAELSHDSPSIVPAVRAKPERLRRADDEWHCAQNRGERRNGDGRGTRYPAPVSLVFGNSIPGLSHARGDDVHSPPRVAVTRRNERWSMDFMSDVVTATVKDLVVGT